MKYMMSLWQQLQVFLLISANCNSMLVLVLAFSVPTVIELVGSCCTLVAERLLQTKFDIPPAAVNMLYSKLLGQNSHTLKLWTVRFPIGLSVCIFIIQSLLILNCLFFLMTASCVVYVQCFICLIIFGYIKIVTENLNNLNSFYWW